MKSSRQLLTSSPVRGVVVSAFLLGFATVSVTSAQEDPLQHANHELKQATKGMVFCTFEERTRWEQKFGVNFGKSVDQQDMLSRLRIGCGVAPTSWLTVYAMGQDARVPFYGVPAPNTIRDTMDLQEAYIRLSGRSEAGFGGTFGRSMLDYGESRIIGTPQWSNVSRTYDQGRLYYRLPKARFEFLMVSPVKRAAGRFQCRRTWSERIWGTYDIVASFWHGRIWWMRTRCAIRKTRLGAGLARARWAPTVSADAFTVRCPTDSRTASRGSDKPVNSGW